MNLIAVIKNPAVKLPEVWTNHIIESSLRDKDSYFWVTEIGNDFVKDIIGAVTFHFSVNMDDIRGKVRTSKIAVPRQMICYFLRKKTKLSLEQIGRIINRNHSTVVHSVRCVEDGLLYDKKTKFHVESIQNIL